MIHKVTYEYKGIKVSIEASEKATSDDVETAINFSKDKLTRLFEPDPGIRCTVSYRHEVPKVLGVKDIKEILGICDKTAYELIEKAKIKGDMFKVIEIGRNKKIPRDSFLMWLEHTDNIHK